MNDDLSVADIKDLLLDRLDDIVENEVPGGRYEGGQYIGDCDGKVIVHMDGRSTMGRGFVGMFAGQRPGKQGGDIINLIQISRGFDRYGDAVQYAKKVYLGMAGRELTEAEKSRMRQKKAQAAERRARDAETAAGKARQRQDDVRATWDAAKPLAGTMGEAYLVEIRRLPRLKPWPISLRYHPKLTHVKDPRFSFPAIIGGVQGPDRKLTGQWRIYLHPDLDPSWDGKAPIKYPKLGFGPTAGGAVRLGKVWACLSTSGMMGLDLTGPDRPDAVAEGIETALGVRAILEATGEDPDRLMIYADSDRHRQNEKTKEIQEPPGQKAAKALMDKCRGLGIKAFIQYPPPGSDWRDVWEATERAQRRQDKFLGKS